MQLTPQHTSPLQLKRLRSVQLLNMLCTKLLIILKSFPIALI